MEIYGSEILMEIYHEELIELGDVTSRKFLGFLNLRFSFLKPGETVGSNRDLKPFRSHCPSYRGEVRAGSHHQRSLRREELRRGVADCALFVS